MLTDYWLGDVTLGACGMRDEFAIY